MERQRGAGNGQERHPVAVKEVNGKKYIHHIQDEIHFDKSKIRNKTF
ncbi:MAG: hypothetical protein K5685_00955 [Bacteroidales bacterium]|nr:hypothetical protein [Bacteroidales bacterium]